MIDKSVSIEVGDIESHLGKSFGFESIVLSSEEATTKDEGRDSPGSY